MNDSAVYGILPTLPRSLARVVSEVLPSSNDRAAFILALVHGPDSVGWVRAMELAEKAEDIMNK